MDEDTEKIEVTRIYEKIHDSKATTIVNVGGARSSKSYSICQYLIRKLSEEPGCQIAVLRTTYPALRRTCMDGSAGILTLLKEYGIYNNGTHNKTFSTFELGKSKIQFISMDEPGKIRSSEFNYVWMEEADQFSYDDYITLKLRLSGPTRTKNKLLLSLNPIDENNWIPRKLLERKDGKFREDVELIHSTYLDNPYLSKEYVEILTGLINQSENHYRVFVLGEWGMVEGVIYKEGSNWDIVKEVPEYDYWAYGLDFGLVSPTALVKVGVKDRELYLEEIVYKPGLKIDQLTDIMSHLPKGDIYADPTGTNKLIIDEINKAGYKCFEGTKSVSHSIDLCKRNKFHVHQNSINLHKELRGYSYKKILNTDRYEDKPVKYDDHACDAFRYGVYGLAERHGFTTAIPRTGPRVRHTVTF